MPISRTTTACILVATLGALACASVQTQQRPRGDQHRLTRTELDEGGSTIVTARDAVRVLRSHWLNPPFGRVASAHVAGARGSVSSAAGQGGVNTAIIVYIDGIRQPDVDALETVPALKVVEMRYLDQNRAVQLHGPGHEAGVIEVTTVDARLRTAPSRPPGRGS
jgi:hypothetical protein